MPSISGGLYLLPLICHVHKCKLLFESNVAEDVPLTLVINLVYAFLCMNNVYWSHLEMCDLYKSIEQNGIEVLKDGFILQCT